MIKAYCPGYTWEGKVHPVMIKPAHEYYTPVLLEDRLTSYVCEPCARQYARDDKLNEVRK